MRPQQNRRLYPQVYTDIRHAPFPADSNDDRHLNPLGTVHGGCLYTLADTVAGFAAASCGFEGPTLSGNMYFLRPTMGVKKLTCESRVVKNGKRIRVVEATIYGDNGQEISRSLLEYMDMQREMVVK